EGPRRVAVAKPFEEELRADHAVSIQDEGPRIRHAFGLPLGGLVADVVGIDRLALGVRQQGGCDLRPVRELLEDGRVVVADTYELDPGLLDRLDVALQLDQLRPAEWSPIGRAEEHEGDLTLLEELVERPLLAPLVGEGELRGRGADLQARLPL